MERKQQTASASVSIAEDILNQIEIRSEGIWRFKETENMPFAAFAQILSRFRKGIIQKISKGLNYSVQKAVFRESNPSLSRSNFLNILQ